MKILSLDTAMAACSAAVIDTAEPRPLAQAFVAMDRGHAEALAPMVAKVLREAAIAPASLDRIVVTIGPGTFTGVRIGLSFARGLGLALGIPVVGIDTLSAIATNEPARANLLVVTDARNEEVYAARFDENSKLVSPPRITTAADAAVGLPTNALVLGSASRVVIAASGRTDLVTSAAGDLPVAAHFARRAEGLAPGVPPSPHYLRAPDAKPQASPLRRITALDFTSATAAAAPLLSQLHCEIFDEGWSEKAFAELLATPGAAAAIALDRGEPVGFVLTRAAADEAEVITIGTRPSVQRRGVARQLLERHIEGLAANGIRLLFLEVAMSNAAARSLYSALGFREAGLRRGYYQRPDGAEDAIVMRLELVA